VNFMKIVFYNMFSICRSTTFSRTLEIKGRLETGRYFFKTSGSRLDFLINGLTRELLTAAGTYPFPIEVLIIFVMIGASSCRHSFSNQVGIKSSSQD